MRKVWLFPLLFFIGVLLFGFSGKQIHPRKLAGIYQSTDSFEEGFFRQYILLSRKREALVIIDSFVSDKQLKQDMLSDGDKGWFTLTGDSLSFSIDSVKSKSTATAFAFGGRHEWIKYSYLHYIRHYFKGKIDDDTLRMQVTTLVDRHPIMWLDPKTDLLRDSLSGQFDTTIQTSVFVRKK